MNLFESHAMMRYVCNSRGLADHWYPNSRDQNLALLAKMEMYLDWHHSNMRAGATGYIFGKYFSGLMHPNAVWNT